MYRIVNRETRYPLKGDFRTEEDAHGFIAKRCDLWNGRGFPTSPEEFEVVPAEEAVQPHHRRQRKAADRPTQMVAGDMVRYPFPTESGKTATLILPVDLTPTDVERLTAMLGVLVLEPETPVENAPA